MPGIKHSPRHLSTAPWSGREGARGVPAPGAAGHRAAPADYSTQQAPLTGTAVPGLGLSAWGDVEATGANPREKEECQQTRRPAGHAISATGQGSPDKPRQGQPGVRSGHSPCAWHGLDRSPSSPNTRVPSSALHPAALFF